MSKVAKIVCVSLMTRVIVDEDATDEQIAELAKGKFIEKIEGELLENLEEIYYDEECPVGTFEEDDVYFQPDFGDGDLITPDGVELWSYYVYSSLEKAKEDFPDRKINTYSGDDIENPYFIK
jgi:hypothetical protein